MGQSTTNLIAACRAKSVRFFDWLLDRDARFAGGRDPLGLQAETLAAGFLRRAGYRVVGRNLILPMGELDLLAISPDETTIVAVEVKSRRVGPVVGAAPPPEAAITAAKRDKLIEIVEHLTVANGWMPSKVRIDVLAVEIMSGDVPPVIRHWPGVIRPH